MNNLDIIRELCYSLAKKGASANITTYCNEAQSVIIKRGIKKHRFTGNGETIISGLKRLIKK